jgi:O-methyltransferase
MYFPPAAGTRKGEPMVKGALKKVLRRLGYEVINVNRPAANGALPWDLDPQTIATYGKVRPFTMTSAERINALVAAARYIIAADIPGSIVECGVWKGGSMMAVAMALVSAHRADRDLYLFDTFRGMTQPTQVDGEHVQTTWASHEKDTHNTWAYAGLDEVKANMATTGYPPDLVHYVVGKVEDTIPQSAPGPIAILRLDTDWYESTKHELDHLFPRLAKGGILIIDDYGSFPGARKAVDEYVSKHQLALFLSRIDNDARLAIKLTDAAEGGR